jgi:hypothetical protein
MSSKMMVTHYQSARVTLGTYARTRDPTDTGCAREESLTEKKLTNKKADTYSEVSKYVYCHVVRATSDEVWIYTWSYWTFTRS